MTIFKGYRDADGAAAVKGYDPVVLGGGQGGPRLIFVKMNDTV